jgi:hypothetical protein
MIDLILAVNEGDGCHFLEFQPLLLLLCIDWWPQRIHQGNDALITSTPVHRSHRAHRPCE